MWRPSRVELTVVPGHGALREFIVRLGTATLRDIHTADYADLGVPCGVILAKPQFTSGMWCSSLSTSLGATYKLHFATLAFGADPWPFGALPGRAAPPEGPVRGAFTAHLLATHERGTWADFRLTGPPGATFDMNGRGIIEIAEGETYGTGGAHLLAAPLENMLRVSFFTEGPKPLQLEWRAPGESAYELVPHTVLTTPPCVTDCVATDWTAWSTCPATCADPVGITRRERPVDIRAQGGKECPDTEEVQPCEAQCDCVVSDWGEWSEEASGIITRERTVVQAPSADDCPSLTESVVVSPPPEPSTTTTTTTTKPLPPITPAVTAQPPSLSNSSSTNSTVSTTTTSTTASSASTTTPT